MLTDLVALTTLEAIEYVFDITCEEVNIIAADGAPMRGPIPQLLDLVEPILQIKWRFDIVRERLLVAVVADDSDGLNQVPRRGVQILLMVDKLSALFVLEKMLAKHLG